ncbi:gluconate 2-dehydrogenase subunit 3 family protein [Mariniflexile ostreae]|uniref:Gluconate 2-dehydrogenase subunit 3 family protein n=1 Tax=Mariniflexile ostreae TaxID=1520892 RepID=A0ABV5FAD6_9FLAO
MNRRTALKNLTMGLGYAVAAPTIMNILASCTAETKSWTPVFLSEDEKVMVTHLVDIIIPETETPGALAVNVPQFIDLMYQNLEKEDNQKLFKQGANLFANKFETKFNTPISKGNKNDIAVLVSEYFNLSHEDSQFVLHQQKLAIQDIPAENIKHYTLYKFLLSVRYYALFGYYTSEKIGKEVLVYDPIPGAYHGCVSLDETTNGKTWTL